MSEPIVKFSLVVTIEGSCLEDIDLGLTKAATERLMARKPHLKNEASVGMVLKTNEEIKPEVKAEVSAVNEKTEQAANVAVDEVLAKRKTKPKKDPVKEIIQNMPVAETAAEVVVPSTVDEALTMVKTITKDDAVTALASINERAGIDAARAVLAQFGVKRLSEMKPEDYESFINKCTAHK